jgi:hypothetical protein
MQGFFAGILTVSVVSSSDDGRERERERESERSSIILG